MNIVAKTCIVAMAVFSVWMISVGIEKAAFDAVNSIEVHHD